MWRFFSTTWHASAAFAVALNYSLSVCDFFFFHAVHGTLKEQVTIKELASSSHTCARTYSRRAHSSLHYTAHSRTLTWMDAHTHMHNNTNTDFLVLFCALVLLPDCVHLWLSAVWLGAVSNHADFTSCVSAVHRDLFALMSIWKLSCRKSSLFQSTPLWQIIIKPELRSLRMYAGKMKRTIRTVVGYFHGCRWCFNRRIQFRGKHGADNEL